MFLSLLSYNFFSFMFFYFYKKTNLKRSLFEMDKITLKRYKCKAHALFRYNLTVNLDRKATVKFVQ